MANCRLPIEKQKRRGMSDPRCLFSNRQSAIASFCRYSHVATRKGGDGRGHSQRLEGLAEQRIARSGVGDGGRAGQVGQASLQKGGQEGCHEGRAAVRKVR